MIQCYREISMGISCSFPPGYHEQKSADYGKLVHDWTNSLEAFLSSQTSLDERTLQGAWSLQMNRELLEIVLHQREYRQFPTSEYDRFLPYYQRVVALARKIQQVVSSKSSRILYKAIITDDEVQDSANSVPQQQPTPSFSLDMHSVAHLFSVAHGCRDPFIRREAVRLLKEKPRREGLWDSVYAGKVGFRNSPCFQRTFPCCRTCHARPETDKMLLQCSPSPYCERREVHPAGSQSTQQTSIPKASEANQADFCSIPGC